MVNVQELEERQIKILERQTNFSWLVTLATIILALGAFIETILTLISLPTDTYLGLVTSLGFLGAMFIISGICFFFILMGMIVYLIILAFIKK